MRYLNHLHSSNPNKTSKEIAVAFNQNLTHIVQKLNAMVKEDIISRKRDGRIFTYILTQKGRGWINNNKELLLYILDQVKNFSSWGRQMYVKSNPALRELLQYPLSSVII